MAKVKAPVSSNQRREIRPALNPEARENQLISLAIDLVEQRLLDGTASSQETTHFLKLATNKAKLERERFELENELIRAKTQALKDQADMKVLYADAIAAMRRYSGHGGDVDYDDDECDDYDDY
jgi:hypothetical protein